MRPSPVALLLVLVLVVGVLALGLTASPEPPMESVGDPPDGGEVMRFLVIGDQGTGSDAQYRVAQAMEEVCARRGCDFALVTGDNLYPTGAPSPDDPKFRTHFEDPYRNLDFPWYVTLGNHDHGDTDAPVGPRAKNEVAYHYRDDRLSDKWRMPARSYAFEHGNVAIVALDTTPIARGDAEETRKQATLLADTFNGTNATWRFAVGHHPYVANGWHGSEMPPDDPMRVFFADGACDDVDVYFAGHAHSLQWLEPVPECGATTFIVSGAGADPRTVIPVNHNTFFQRGLTLGFFWVHVQGDTFTGVVFDVEGNVLYERTIRHEDLQVTEP